MHVQTHRAKPASSDTKTYFYNLLTPSLYNKFLLLKLCNLLTVMDY